MVDTTAYDESSISVLEGLEPVRKRPGMYTRPEDPGHIIQEVIDNAADEALGGHATRIDVTVHDDGSVSVEDNGRGIPVGLHPEKQIPVVTLVFTTLHAGGKFEKANGGAYAFSGGLHGVGVAVTTALSHRIEIEVRRGGHIYNVVIEDGGQKVGEVTEAGRCEESETGTRVRVWPNPKYFDSPKLPLAHLERLLRSKAVLLPGVCVSLTVGTDRREWSYSGGLSQYLADDLAGGREPAALLYCGERYIDAESERAGAASGFASGEGAAFALGWYPEGGVPGESFVNLIPTTAGGTHESGLKGGVFEAVRSFIEHHGLLPRGVKLAQEDVVSRMGYVLSAKILDPQFQGQIKEKLNSRHAVRLMSAVVRDDLEVWLNANPEHARVISDIAVRMALSRQKDAQRVEKKKYSGIAVLPGKLTDCEPGPDNELFLVEGDSAGGSAKGARNKITQAVLPLRGKVLNTWGVEADRLFMNSEIHDIAVAVGVDPHTLSDDSAKVLANRRYARIIIMTDADVDGAHIRALLLTLFFRHFPHLVLGGHVQIAQPPLYRIDVEHTGKSRPRRPEYALDDAEQVAIMQKLQREGIKPDRIKVGRFKGLGEMNPDQLKETSMDPATRRVLPVVYNRDEHEAAVAMFELLMGKEEAAGRREWMAAKGHTVIADI